MSDSEMDYEYRLRTRVQGPLKSTGSSGRLSRPTILAPNLVAACAAAVGAYCLLGSLLGSRLLGSRDFGGAFSAGALDCCFGAIVSLPLARACW